MKRFAAAMMALMMLMGMTHAGALELFIEGELEIGDVEFDTWTGMYIAENEEGLDVLYDSWGNAVSDAYMEISTEPNFEPYFYVQQLWGRNTTGLMDTAGQLIVPMDYGKIDIKGDRWIMACVLEKGTDGEQIARVDVYYDGQKVASLNGDEIGNLGRSIAFGNYLSFITPEKMTFWLDPTGNVSNTDEMDHVGSEYHWKDNVCIHLPTGQAMFTSECTLAVDDVDQFFWYYKDYDVDDDGCLDGAGAMVDLQGNVISSGQDYDFVDCSFWNRVFLISQKNGRYGVVDLEGNEIVPTRYREYLGYTSYGDGYWQFRQENGKVVYVDSNGDVVALAPDEGANGPVSVFELDDGYAIFSLEEGLLPGRYDDAVGPWDDQQAVVVQKDGLWGVVDMEGNEVIPITLENEPEISVDGLHVYDRDHGVLYNLFYGY